MIVIRKFFKDIYNKGNFKDYFKRNKLFFLVSACLVLLSVHTGINHTVVDNSFVNYIISPIGYNLGFNTNGNLISTFIYTLTYSLYTILLGLSFSILSILVVVANEIAVGNIFNYNAIVYMINDVFVLVGALLVAKIEVRIIKELLSFSLKDIFSKIRVPLKDLILTITMILVIIVVISIIH